MQTATARTSRMNNDNDLKSILAKFLYHMSTHVKSVVYSEAIVWMSALA